MTSTITDQLKGLKLDFVRPSGRAPDQLRDIKITRGFTKHAEGSVLIEFGSTQVLCTASVERGVPRFLRGSGTGWVTAEYGMLPRATHSRNGREAARGKQGGRTLEIQRLIGRSLRAAINMEALGENTLRIDCDVIQADAGTRTAAISGSWVALQRACERLVQQGVLNTNPVQSQVAAVSVGVIHKRPLLDLDYSEDSQADVDLNVVMNGAGHLLELQGTAEGAPFSRQQLNDLLDLAEPGLKQIMHDQNLALSSR